MKSLTRIFTILGISALLVSGCGASAVATPTIVPHAPTSVPLATVTSIPTAVQPKATDATPGILAVVPVADIPTMLAATADTIWVQSHGPGILTRIDPSQNKEVERLKDVPSHCEVISGGGFVWTSEAYAGSPRGSVTKVDPASGAVMDSFALEAACGLAANETDLWVVSPALGQALRYDAATLKEQAVIPLAKDVFEIEIGSDAVWASGATNGGMVWRIDPATNQVVKSFDLPNSGFAGLVAAFGSIWVGSGNKGLLFRIDPATNAVTTIEVNKGMSGITAGPDAIWVTGSADRTIYRIDPATNSVSGSLSTTYSELGTPVVAFGSLWVPTVEYNVVLRIDPAIFDSSAATMP